MKCSTFSLGELVKIKYGKNQKHVVSDEGKIPIYGTGGIMGYATEFLYDKPSVLIGRKGTIGKVKYADHPFWTVDTLFYTEVNDEIVLPMFLFYLMSQLDLNVYNEGTTIPSLRTETLNRLEFSIPPLPIQRKIVSILSALDDKIETNNAICRNLEEQMESMYNKLFVENYNSEWTQGTISDLGRIVGGGTPSKKEPSYYTQQGISWITPKDLSRNTAKFIQRGEVDITQEGLNASGATIMPAGTVLFSSRAPIGYIAIACNDVTTNQGFKSVIPHDFVGSAYLYYFLKANKNAIEMQASGSTFLEVSAGIMRQVPAIIPDKSTLDIFKHFCNPLFEMQRKLETETVSLSQIREAMLPKLMNGELSVENIN